MNAKDPSCPLCRAERLTVWHHEDDLLWVANCANRRCGDPIVVFRRHAPEPTYGEWYHAMQVARLLFPDLRPRVKRRQLPDHPHFHLTRDGR